MSRQGEHPSDLARLAVTTDTIKLVIADLKTMIHKEIDGVDELIGEKGSTVPGDYLQHLEGYLLGMTVMGHKIIHYLQQKFLC